MNKEFTLVKSYAPKTFIEEVNQKLLEGWEFHGTTLATGVGESVCYVQAFTKFLPIEHKNTGTGGVKFR